MRFVAVDVVPWGIALEGDDRLRLLKHWASRLASKGVRHNVLVFGELLMHQEKIVKNDD